MISAADRRTPDGEGSQQPSSDVVIPAYRRLDDFFARNILPKLRDDRRHLGYARRRAYYQNRIQYHTTTYLTADEIHQIGLKEVERIRGEMEQDHRPGRVQGLVPGLSDSSCAPDPQFYYKAGDELFEAYLAACPNASTRSS